MRRDQLEHAIRTAVRSSNDLRTSASPNSLHSAAISHFRAGRLAVDSGGDPREEWQRVSIPADSQQRVPAYPGLEDLLHDVVSRR